MMAGERNFEPLKLRYQSPAGRVVAVGEHLNRNAALTQAATEGQDHALETADVDVLCDDQHPLRTAVRRGPFRR